MNNQIIGINEEAMKKLILEIYDYRDKLSKILSTAEKLVYETSTYYSGEDADELRNRFKLFSSNFETLVKNIQSYGDDLQEIVVNYRQSVLKSVDIFKN